MSAPRVLVVDDSDVTRLVLARTLAREGFEVLQARDGLDGAVQALSEQPDAVVTDLEMPAMDGYQLVRLLKADPGSAHIPVLVVTSHGEAPSRYWGLRTGADAYLTKGQEAAELGPAVRRLIAAVRPHARRVTAPPSGPLEVFARLARHLDVALMDATLTGSLLERGMASDDLSEANLVALRTLADVVDARALAVGISEAHAVTIHVLLPEEFSDRGVARLASAVVENLPVTPGAALELIVNGDRDTSPAPELSDLSLFPLQVRDAGGVLAVLPRDAAQFAALSRPLVERLVGHLALVLDNARLSQRLRELSMLDGLTRLLNHRAIHDRLDEELKRSFRYAHPFTIVLCDLDHFKAVNDTHGHLAGDAVLLTAAQAMKRCLRSADAFGRYGGEEFLALLPESDLEAGQRAAERLRLALVEQSVTLGSGKLVKVTGSFGVASRDELGEVATAGSLIGLADRRLYLSKAGGRNRVTP